MSAGSDFRAAVGFLTPLGRGASTPSPRSMVYFPLVGMALGSALGWAWRRSSRQLGPMAAAALVVASDCALTGALHLDGLADAADGLLAHAPARGRLEIMAEPQVGTFGTAAVGVALISRAAALASQPPSPLLLAAICCSSRSVMVVGSRVMPYARAEGLATAFLNEDACPVRADGPGGTDAPDGPARPARPAPVLAAGLAGAGVAMVAASVAAGRRGARAVLAGWLAGAAVLWLGHRRLGGFTGDVLGAAGVACEVAGLLAASAGTASAAGRGRPQKAE